MNVSKPTTSTWSTGGTGGKTAGASDGDRKWPVQPGCSTTTSTDTFTSSTSTSTSTSTKVNLTGT